MTVTRQAVKDGINLIFKNRTNTEVRNIQDKELHFSFELIVKDKSFNTPPYVEITHFQAHENYIHINCMIQCQRYNIFMNYIDFVKKLA